VDVNPAFLSVLTYGKQAGGGDILV
jgi:hypothetical protein